MEQLAVEQSVWIAAPREQVWSAITLPEHLAEWWGDNWEIPSLQVGEIVKFSGADESADVSRAKIEAVDPPRQFTLRWEPHSWYPELVTTYRLETENGGTRVNLTEAGFEALPDAMRQKRFDETVAGYTEVLEDLKTYVQRMTA